MQLDTHLRFCKGKIVCILDSDDFFKKNKIRKVVDFLKKIRKVKSFLIIQFCLVVFLSKKRLGIDI